MRPFSPATPPFLYRWGCYNYRTNDESTSNLICPFLEMTFQSFGETQRSVISSEVVPSWKRPIQQTVCVRVPELDITTFLASWVELAIRNWTW